MINQVLWTIDNEISGRQFERMSTDLLFRNGYHDIVPVEPQDAGRDAEEHPVEGRGRFGELCFFQFSLERDWKGKLRRDMLRVHEAGHRPSRFVFVTSRVARGVDRDVIGREAMDKYGWDLTVYSREWLRLQLEEVHPDLAHKYLGVEAVGPSRQLLTSYPGSRLEGDALASISVLFEAGEFERACVELLDLAGRDVRNPAVWEALAWSQYQTYRYDEAMNSINRAIDLSDSPRGQSIRACILTERGIRRGDRASLIEARDTFLWVAGHEGRGSWVDFYNLGNVLSALGQHDVAINHYIQAAELAPGEVQVWKNLASTYHLVGDHQKEMECFDRALDLDPLKPEALASKGVSLLVDFGLAEDAAAHLEKAVSVNDAWGVQWPHIWYWLTQAYSTSGRYVDALRCVEEGLRHQPGHRALREQKSNLLAQLIEVDEGYVALAERFWQPALELEPRDFTVRQRLVRLKINQADETAAWGLLDECFRVFDMTGMPSLSASGFNLNDVLDALENLPMYYRYRAYRPIGVYWDPEDELYDIGVEPPWSETIEQRLTAYAAIPFGTLASEFGRLANDVSSEDPFSSALQAHAAALTMVVTEASRELAPLIPLEGSAVEKSSPISNIVMFLGLLGLREVSAQVGFLSAQFDLPAGPIQAAIDSFPYDELYVNIVSGCLQPLNDEVHFAPE